MITVEASGKKSVSVDLLIDGTNRVSCQLPLATPCAYAWNTATVANGNHSVQVSQKGQIVTTATPVVSNAPVLSIVAPTNVVAGGSAFTLTVSGSGFVTGGTVLWNGSPRPTAFVSPSQFTASIVAGDITSAGSATITATNPGSALSNPLALTVSAPPPPPPPPPPSSPSSSRYYDPNEVLVAPVGVGQVWYVDGTNGNNSNAGVSSGAAFKTVQKGIDMARHGDTVMIRAGLYRERLVFHTSGTAQGRIVVGPYGDGRVILDASTAVTGWTLVAGQVYRATPGFTPTAVVVDDIPLFPEFSQGALTEGRWYFDSSTGALYLWAPGGGNPATRDVGVITSDLSQQGVELYVISYVTLYGLTVRFAGGNGIMVYGDYVRVEKSRALFNGKAGVTFLADSQNTTAGGALIKSEIYFNVITNWPRGRWKWGGWPGAASSQGTPNFTFQGNLSHRNGGEGLAAYLGSGGTIFQDNIVGDNWSVNIYNDNQPNGTITNNLIVCHTPDPRDAYNNGDTTPEDGLVLRRLRAEGIMTADEYYGVTPAANLQNVLIANNVILNCRRGLQHYGQAAGSGLRNVRVLNNTIVVPSVLNSGETGGYIAGISIPYNNGNNVGAIYENNLVYATNPATWVLYGDIEASPLDLFSGLTMDHNLWFHTANAKPFHWGLAGYSSFDYAFTGWVGLPGAVHGVGDIYADPQLIDLMTDNPEDKRPVSATAPGVDRGAAVGLSVDFDWGARPLGAGVDIGAFEAF